MVKQQLTGVLLLLVGIGVVTGGFLGPFSTYQEVQSHETTEAEILSSDIESATEQDDGETEVEYYPRIEYEYTVDGTSYTDVRVFHASQVGNEAGELRGKEFDSQNKAQNIASKYQSGSTATVRYDPGDHELSYLEDPSQSLLQTVGIMGLLGLVFGGMGLGGILGLVSLDD
jgi:hypothetical protein